MLTEEGYQLAIASNHQNVGQFEHALFHKLTLPRIKEVDSVCLVLSTANDNNYFHCLFQIAPKLWYIKENGYDPEHIDAFLLELSAHDFQKEILAALGIDRERVIDLKTYPYVKARRLLVTPTFYKPEPWICQGIRSLFLPENFETSGTPKRLYISRNNASYRKIINEAELLKLLARFDFETVYTEGLTIKEQAHLFHNAEAVLTSHGAALANIVFCQEQTAIIEIRGKSYNDGLGDLYEHISSVCNLQHYTYLCEEKENSLGANPMYLDLQLDIRELEASFSQLFSEVSQELQHPLKL
ncbi:glycosyltransferase 61 family protein [Sabulibacter ruber]|uniref:glycosyltransferase 61 family protein n=1 Tax=Sabulibacter ruber TaxID=2811901 RepID=UPI001A95DEA8